MSRRQIVCATTEGLRYALPGPRPSIGAAVPGLQVPLGCGLGRGPGPPAGTRARCLWSLGVLAILAGLAGCRTQPGQRPGVLRPSGPAYRPLSTRISWSPDSRRLALLPWRPADPLLLVDASAGSATPLQYGRGLLEAGQLAWRKRSGALCYVADDYADAAPPGAGALPYAPGGSRLYEVDAMGELLRTSAMPGCSLPTDMAWSSDDALLAVADCGAHATTLRLYDPDLKPLRHFDLHVQVSNIQWPPPRTGHLLMYACPAGSNDSRLADLDVATGAVRDALRDDHLTVDSWVYAPSGEIYLGDAHGYALELLWAERVAPRPGVNPPPDELFSRLCSDSYGWVWKYDSATRLTTAVVAKTALPWLAVVRSGFSADAQFAVGLSQGRVCAVELSTGRVRQLSAGPRDSSPVLSPDGKRLAFIREGVQLWTKDLATGRETELRSLDARPDEETRESGS